MSIKRHRVLLVTSGFPPTMSADMQRARLLTYDLPEMNWEVEVLTPSASFQRPGWVEPEARALLAEHVQVHESIPRLDRVFRYLGVGSVGWRAFWPMYRCGCRVLGGRDFDLVYISTTQFVLFCLGPLWLRRLGVPFVLDLHDPWIRPQNSHRTTPQGLKFYINSRISPALERFALRAAQGLVAVSPSYLNQLSARYPKFTCLAKKRCAVIPFGATDRDFEWAQSHRGASAVRVPEGSMNIAYVGAGGSNMAKSFRRIAKALARIRCRAPQLLKDVRMLLVGTSTDWVPGDPKVLHLVAQEEGVGDLVDEQPAHVAYLRAVQLILEADGVLVLGVDDPAYMPSKLFSYALTGKPLLACLHVDSQANQYFRELPHLGRLIHFDATAAGEVEEDEQVRMFLDEVGCRATFSRTTEIEPYLSRAAAKRHADLFEACLER